MAELQHYEKSVPNKISARWPVTIFTGKQRIIQAESRTVTAEGLFLECEPEPPLNEILRIVITPKPELTVVVRGTLIFSNPKGTNSSLSFSNKSLSFVKVSKEDRHLLHNLIQRMEEEKMGVERRMKT